MHLSLVMEVVTMMYKYKGLIFEIINNIVLGAFMGSVVLDFVFLIYESYNIFIINNYIQYGIFKYPTLCTDFESFGDTFILLNLPLRFSIYFSGFMIELSFLIFIFFILDSTRLYIEEMADIGIIDEDQNAKLRKWLDKLRLILFCLSLTFIHVGCYDFISLYNVIRYNLRYL